MRRNFGMPQPNGYRKAMRFMRHANKFGLPIVTFVDTPGAYAGRAAEELGQVGVLCLRACGRVVCGGVWCTGRSTSPKAASAEGWMPLAALGAAVVRHQAGSSCMRARLTYKQLLASTHQTLSRPRR